MGVVDFAQYLAQAITPGQAIEGNVVKIIADNGAEVGDVVFKVIEGGNGAASEVGVGVQTAAGGASITTGTAIMAMDLPTVFAAIAPALGIVAGVGIYELVSGDTDFHNRLLNAMFEDGETLGGKVIGYWSGHNLFFSDKVIENVKSALLEANVYVGDYVFPDVSNNIVIIHDETSTSVPYTSYNAATKSIGYPPTYQPITETITPITRAILENTTTHELYALPKAFLSGYYTPERATLNYSFDVSQYSSEERGWFINWYDSSGERKGITSLSSRLYTSNGVTKNILYTSMIADLEDKPALYNYFVGSGWLNARSAHPSWESELNIAMHFVGEQEAGQYVQPDATVPDSNPFPTTYPDWYPLNYPETLPDPGELPTVYPVKYPGTEPNPYPDQDPAQNPDPESVPDTYPYAIPNFDIPNPGIPDVPTPDPDPQPDPDPVPVPDSPNVPADPVDPNIPPTPSIPIVIPPLPDTVNSSKLFTVYNPTSSQLDALGGYLWDSSIIAAIRDIWQEPMDGLISLQQIFVTPPTSGSHNIILGFLDSGVSSKVVSTQFVTIDCGTVSVPENKGNCTDYAPYTSLHLYLPFVGIVELDTNECMNSDISVKYKVDVYTGTCLAQISVERQEDMPNDPILYTFSGNCSQQLPLTSGNATGVLSALVGAISTGISVASGGGLSTLAGAQLLGNSLTHEMMHVSHSGNISANAGIMGQKKPYLIIGRRHNYDANAYNSYYGFPANKTVILGNHTGFARMKSGYVKTSAMKEEYEEIMRLLENGVFL